MRGQRRLGDLNMGLLIDLLGDSQMRFSNSLIAIAAILAAAFSAPVAQAVPLTGDQYYPAFGSNCCGDVSFSSTSFTVGPAVETVLNFGGTHINFDFDASSLAIAFLGSTTPRSDPTGAFNGPSFTDATGDFGSISSSLAAPWAQCR